MKEDARNLELSGDQGSLLDGLPISCLGGEDGVSDLTTTNSEDGEEGIGELLYLLAGWTFEPG